nr:pentatricopeptide repeat-containing protein [Tanacetum cinerariifolium]
MFVEFVIQNQFFSYSLKEFAQILDIPCEGVCVFTKNWLLDKLAYGVPTVGPYQTNPPSPDDIISYIRIDREGQVYRIRREEEIDVYEHQILSREIVLTLKPLEEIIQENIFCLGGNRDHVSTCLCYMLYCVPNSEKLNLTYCMAKQMEWVTKQARLNLPYGMLLTRLFKFIISESSELLNESYSERLERIMAREEVVTPLLLPPPLTNHPPLILMMTMMEMAKGPRVDEDVTTTPSPTTTSSLLLITFLILHYHPHHNHLSWVIPFTLTIMTIMGRLVIVGFHNRNLIFSLRDEMNLMFAHIEYLITSTMNSLSPPHP